MLEDFSTRGTAGAGRFAASLGVALVAFGGLATSVVMASAAVREAILEDEVMVEFMPPPDVPEPEPPPPPPPPPPEATPPPPDAPAARRGTPRPEIEVPDEIPDERPEESDEPLPPPADPFAPEEEGDPNGTEDGVIGGVVGGTGHGPPPAEPTAAVAAPEPPPRRVLRPERVPEGGTPPRPIEQSVTPDIPAELRSAGVPTIRIIVRVILDEEGVPRQVSVLRGHPLMPDENVVRAVMQWRFSPCLTSGGEAFLCQHIFPLTFRVVL